MNVPLTREQEDAAERLVAAGVFTSKEEAVNQSHEWLREQADLLDALRNDIQHGLEQLERGEGAPLDFDELKRAARRRHLLR